MFPIKNVITKLKHFVNARGVVSQLTVSAGCALLVWLAWSRLFSATAFVPKYLRRYLLFPEGYTLPERELSQAEIDKLIVKVEKLNFAAEIFNWKKHGSLRLDSPIIVIQVHKDVERLQHLIISLAQVHFIQQALLVFSHSYYDEEMNALVKSIRFCRFMQIFYPYSLQLYPDKFPGVDSHDCNSSTLSPAEGRECSDRDARRTEHKQHWWWKAHFVFEGLDVPTERRVVVFLEEDDYVLPDLLYMLRFVRRALVYFPTAEVMALGRPHAERLDSDTLIVDRWTPLHARGLAINGSAWRRIAAQGSLFCMYDDCSWSYSMAHLFSGFPGGLVDVMACMAPRVLPTRSLTSTGSALLAARLGAAVGARAALFPPRPRVVVTVSQAGRVRREWRAPRGNGGWADLRDQLLCLEARAPTTTEPTTADVPAWNITRHHLGDLDNAVAARTNVGAKFIRIRG